MNRRRLLFLICISLNVWLRAADAQNLKAYLDAERVHVATTEVHFISGRVLERLQNGAAVPLVIQLTATDSAGRTLSQAAERVALSYDLWEERYSAVQESPRRVGSGLSAAGAEAWCIENVSLPVSALAGQKSFVLKLEIHAAEDASRAENGPGMSVAGLVDVFSRKAREQPSRWSAATGSIRLSDLKEKNRKSGTQSFPARRL